MERNKFVRLLLNDSKVSLDASLVEQGWPAQPASTCATANDVDTLLSNYIVCLVTSCLQDAAPPFSANICHDTSGS